MFRDAAAITRSRLRATQGLLAVITRGQSSCNAVVVFGRSNLLSTELNEFRISADAQDILIQTSDYKPNGMITEPQPNDRIAVIMPDSSTKNFDVRPPSKGQQCFQTTQLGTELRVYCRQVSPIPTTV